MADFWKSFKEWARISNKDPKDELNKSGYSLVSSKELTADNLKLWRELPEEIRNDPALAPFLQMYEESGGTNTQSKLPKKLPGVHSAPAIIQDDNIELENGKKNVIIIEDDDEDDDEHEVKTTKAIQNNKIRQAKYYIKMTALLGCWLFFTVTFLLCNEKHDEEIISYVDNWENKSITIYTNQSISGVTLTLSGPFLSEHAQMKLNSNVYDAAPKIEVWLEGLDAENSLQKSKPWTLLLDEANTQEKLSKVLHFESSSNITKPMLRMSSTSTKTVAFVLSYNLSPVDVTTGVIYACALLTGLYLLIIFEITNRTMAAITVSTMSLAALALTGQRPSLPELISWLDEETLLLLLCMMILVAIMAETGIFDFLAVFTFEVTKGRLWPLIILLCTITAVLSTFLDNVTTVLLMSPVTIRLCEVMELDPVPILMFMAIYSNVGGCATPVGDPPNVIVVSNKAVSQAGINFTNFTAHMGLGIIFIFLQTTLQIRFLFRDTNSLRMAVPKEIQDLTRQISIWRRAAASLPHLSQDVQVVRERLERKINKLNAQLELLIKESHKRACPKDTFRSTLVELKEKYKIRDKALLIKSSIAISFVVIVFFLHSTPELNRVSLAWTALLGAILLLTLADREDLEPILHRVEWSTLLFFAALFVLMEALSKLGLILYIGGLMEQLILNVNEEARLAVALMLILWVSGVISAFVDNIPLTTMMVRVVVAIGSNPLLNLPMAPLVWALLFGACLGGNGTLIAASANVVCAGVAEQHGYKFTFSRFFKVGFPIMIGHLLVASVYLLICHCVFVWH